MGTQYRSEHSKFSGRWSGMVALFRTMVGVSIVSGLLVVLLWSEQQVGVKTPAHTHFHAHARGIPDTSLAEGEGGPEEEEEFETVTERLEPRPPAFPSNEHTPTNSTVTLTTRRRASISFRSATSSPVLERGSGTSSSSSSSSPSSSSSSTPSSNHSSDASEAKLVFTIEQEPPSGSGGGGDGAAAASAGPFSPKIYVITPTYRRPEQVGGAPLLRYAFPQVAELTRLSQTLMLVPNLHWLVAEDAVAPTRQVLAFLDSCSVPHTYLLVPNKEGLFRGSLSSPTGRKTNSRILQPASCTSLVSSYTGEL
ncbi:osteocalcin 2-like [Penaeus chinensis]|uniref:osteocalcin 2-like n=1 Tax=Penaeus chinensis TaxID=139456 RepID=UPI001FB79E7C|nr:osteocalcin 2-like [Penaeus chinensis]